MKPDYSDVLARLRERRAELSGYAPVTEPVDMRPLRDKIAQAMANIRARCELCNAPEPVTRHVATSAKPKAGFFV